MRNKRSYLFPIVVVLAGALSIYLWLESDGEAEARFGSSERSDSTDVSHASHDEHASTASLGDANETAGQPPGASVGAQNDTQQATHPTRPGAAAGPHPRGPASRDMVSFLERWSGTRDWTIHKDDLGRPFKIAGAKLQGAMSSPAQERTFVSGFVEQAGFDEPPALARSEDSGVRDTRLIDYRQSYAPAGGGETIPVYDAWVRFVADGKGDVFLVTSQLRPIDPEVKAEVKLSDEEAIEIARAHIGEDQAVFEVRSPRMIHAEARPHQLVTQIVMTGINPHKLLLVGHDSRAVIDETLLSMH